MNFKTKTLMTVLLLSSAIFAQDDEYEDKPAFGLYGEVAHFSDITFSNLQKPDAEDPNGLTASYSLTNKDDFAWTPIVGVSGQLPFIYKNYVTLQATVGGMYLTYKLHSDDARAIAAKAQDKEFNSFAFVVQGGPEFGYPVIARASDQTFLKPYVFGNILIGKTFNSGTAFQNDMYVGLTSGLGARYTKKMVSFEGGLKAGVWMWKPTYDAAKGGVDPLKRDKGEYNYMRAVFYQNFTPFVAVNFSTF